MTAPLPTKGQVPCDGCGRYHGSVGELHACMSSEIRRLRARATRAESILGEASLKLDAVREAVK